MEEEDQKREDSNAGIRRELADHRVEDAQIAAELKGLIANVEERLGAMKWMLIILIGLGMINGIASLVTHAAK